MEKKLTEIKEATFGVLKNKQTFVAPIHEQSPLPDGMLQILTLQ